MYARLDDNYNSFSASPLNGFGDNYNEMYSIASPGGFSASYHYPTGGLYGTGRMEHDRFAHEEPIQEYGLKGDMIKELNKKEGFTTDITQEDLKETNKPNLWTYAILFFLLYVISQFGSVAIMKYLEENVHSGKQIHYRDMAIYTAFFIVIFIIFVLVFKVPLNEIENA